MDVRDVILALNQRQWRDYAHAIRRCSLQLELYRWSLSESSTTSLWIRSEHEHWSLNSGRHSPVAKIMQYVLLYHRADLLGIHSVCRTLIEVPTS